MSAELLRSTRPSSGHRDTYGAATRSFRQTQDDTAHGSFVDFPAWTMTATRALFPDPATSSTPKTQSHGKQNQIEWRLIAFMIAFIACNTAWAVRLGVSVQGQFLHGEDKVIIATVFLALAPLGPCLTFVFEKYAEGLALVGFFFWYIWAFLMGMSEWLPSIVVLVHLVFNRHRHWLWESARTVITGWALAAQIVLYPSENIGFSLLVVWYGWIQYWASSGPSPICVWQGHDSTQASSSPISSPPPRQWLILSSDEENTEQIRTEIERARNIAEGKRPGMTERISRLKINFASLKLADRVGFGSFGEVYRALLNDGQVVAVKRIPRTQLSEKKIVSMFTEIDVVSSCSHPNVIRMVGWSDDPYVLVCLEYANGGSLKDYLRSRSSTLEVGWCLTKTKMAMDAAAGLAYLHNRGILHRDVKVDNLLVCSSGENSIVVKIADFGTSRSNDCDAVNNPMTPVGSPLWLAPEVARGIKDYGVKADVWSFGVCLCEIATHCTPYEDLRTHESYFNLIGVSQGKILPVEQLLSASEILTHGRRNTTNFGNLTRLVEKCCAFDPEMRPLMNAVMFELLQMMMVDEDAAQEELQMFHHEPHRPSDKSSSFTVRRASSLRMNEPDLAESKDVLAPLNSPSFTKKRARISDPTSSRKSGKNLTALFAAELGYNKPASFRSTASDGGEADAKSSTVTEGRRSD